MPTSGKPPEVSSREWGGAWPEDVFFSFISLTSDTSIRAVEAGQSESGTALSGLLAAIPSAPTVARDRRIAEWAAKVQAHPGYARLRRMAGLNNVMAERVRLSERNALFAGVVGEVRLVNRIAKVLGCYKASFVPKRATLTHQRRVKSAVGKLRGLLMPGAQPADVFEMSDLHRALQKLDEELAATIYVADTLSKRPARADKDAAQRYWVGGFCGSMIDAFGEAPPAIVKEVAAELGFTPDDATIDRYIQKAKADTERRSATS